MQKKRDAEKKLEVKMGEVEVRTKEVKVRSKEYVLSGATKVTQVKRREGIVAPCDRSDPVQTMG